LPPELIRKLVRDHYDVFRHCYEDGLRRNKSLAGRVAASFIIERDGSVHRVKLGSWRSSFGVQGRDDPARGDTVCTTMRDDAVVRCIVSGFKELRFPQPETGIVRVNYPLYFAPGD
jgi:hypothetical protein